MNLRELATHLKLGKDGAKSRLRLIGMQPKEVYSQSDLSELQKFAFERRHPNHKVSDLEIYNYFMSNKENGTGTMAKAFDIPYYILDHRLNKILKSEFITVHSKINYT